MNVLCFYILHNQPCVKQIVELPTNDNVYSYTYPYYSLSGILLIE